MNSKDKVKRYLKQLSLERGITHSEIEQLRRIMPKENGFLESLSDNDDVHLLIKPKTSPDGGWMGYVVFSNTIIIADEYSKYPTARQIKRLKTVYDSLCSKRKG